VTPLDLRRTTATALVFSLVSLGLVAAADAQVRPRPVPRVVSGPTPRAGSWEFGGGLGLAGGFELGDSAAQLTRNPGTTSGPFDLFTTDSRLGAAPGAHARLGYYLTRAIAVEAGIRYARPVLSVRIAGDAESAPNLTADETINQYIVDGSLVLHFPRAAFARGRVVPFVTGGAGYLRELHTGNELIETGTEYHATGGFKLWFGQSRRRFGVRGEAGVSIRDGGFEFDEALRTVPIAAASLIYLF
jgi:hypothetical protein